MKVTIGPYTKWIGPYQIAEKLMFWVPEEKDEYGFPCKADQVHDFGTYLSNWNWLVKICNWIESKKKRKIKVHIDYYDIWSADHTLALIIHPVLLKLKEHKHGSPSVDDDDVPEYLRSTSAPELTQDQKDRGHTDNNHHERWSWVLDEMIWAFAQQIDDDAERQFHTGNHDIQWKKVDKNGNALPEDYEGKDYLCEMVTGPEDTHVFDSKGYKEWKKRKANGFRLFGKYYQALWD